MTASASRSAHQSGSWVRASSSLLRGVVRAEVPVQMPHVFAPAEDLADEALDCGQRRLVVAVGALGGVDGVEGMQHAEVQRHGQQRVRHRPVVAHHGVLVAAEGGQSVVDEARQRALGLGRGDGEQTRAVGADGVEVHAVEVAADLLVDVVLAGLVGLGHLEGRLLLRRGFAVVLVVVPAAADGVGAVHQDVEAAALVAVEVLHAEARAVAGPLGENRCGAARMSAWAERRRPGPVLAQPVDELLGGVRGGFVDQDRAAVALEGVGIGVGLDQGGAVAEVVVGVPQRGEHQVQLLAVVAALGSAPRWPRRAEPRGGRARRRTPRVRAGRRTATGECRRGRAHSAGGYPRD